MAVQLAAKIIFSVLLATVFAEDAVKPKQGRQLNWDSDLPSPSYHSADYLASPSSVLSQSKSNLDAPDQDISRDSYSPPASSYYPSSDYGYEAAPSDTASYTGNSATSYGYRYRPFINPTTSRPFYQDRHQDEKVSSLSGYQSGRLAFFPLPSRLNYSQVAASRGGARVEDRSDDVNRALYDDDAPLGGVASRPSTSSTSLLGSTTLRNVQSRQDDFGYGGGMYSVPPAGAYDAYGGYGGYGGTGGYGGYGGTGGYGGYGGTGGYGGYGGNGYGAGNYANSYRNGYGYSFGYGYGQPSTGGYGNYGGYGLGGYGGYGGYGGSGSYGLGGYGGYGGNGGYGGYRSPLYAGYRGYGNYGYGNYGYGMDGIGVYKPYSFMKKLKKAYKHLYKYGFPVNGGYGGYGGYGGQGAYGGYGAVAPYDSWFYDVPTVWDLGKFALKSVAKSVIKPIYSLISPFCGPFFYKRSDGLVDDKQNSFISALTAFLPIGLFLAAVVPNIVTVSAGRKKRSETEEIELAKEQATFPILDMISQYGARSLQEPKCQSRIVCEMARMGGMPEANMLQRALWITANYVPESLARMAGADKLLRSIRSQKCAEFKCASD